MRIDQKPSFKSEERAEKDEQRRAHRHARHEKRQKSETARRAPGRRISGIARPTKVATTAQTDGHDERRHDARARTARTQRAIREERRVIFDRERERDARQRPLADRHQRQPEEREIDQADEDEAAPLGHARPAAPVAPVAPPSRGHRRTRSLSASAIAQLFSTRNVDDRSPKRRPTSIRTTRSTARSAMTKVVSAATTG